MKQLRVGLPVALVIISAMNIAFNYAADNTNAVWANISALCAWLIVAGDETVKFIEERKHTV